MKIFEFQFNPKAQKDRFFQVFSFESTGGQEEQGSLYVVGELQNALPSNSNFLQKLADLIYKEYAGSAKPAQKKSFSHTNALKASLRKANDFLAAESKKGNVDWLGNMHVAILLFAPANGGYTLYFTKAGNIKVWMARNGSIVDVGMSLEKEDGSDPAKVFGNVGSGKVMADDRIAVATKELFDVFSKENLLQTVSQFKEEKQFKNLFKSKEKALSKTAGALLFFFVEPFVRQTEGQPIENGASFSMPTNLLSRFSLPNLSFLMSIKRPKISLPTLPAAPKISPLVPEKFIPKSKLQAFYNVPPMKKALGLLFILALILGIGFAIFKGGTFQGISLDAQGALESAQTLQFQAEQQLALENEREANRLFQEAWQKIVPFADREDFTQIRQELETQLQKLNKVEFIGNPELFAQLDTSGLPETPQKVLALNGNLYFYNPISSQLLAVEAASKSQAVLSPGRNLKFGDNFGNAFLFFADPNVLISFSETAGWQEHQVAFPENFTPQGISTFGQSIYFFDGGSGQIAKASLAQTATEQWISAASAKKPLDAASITIDGNIWVLRQNGEIQRYFKGQYEESIALQIFPVLENPTKIYTRAELSYLYILDAEHARVLVLSKFGDIIRQYQSPEFREATDFAVPPGGSTMYVLRGTQVFRIADIVPE